MNSTTIYSIYLLRNFLYIVIKFYFATTPFIFSQKTDLPFVICFIYSPHQYELTLYEAQTLHV